MWLVWHPGFGGWGEIGWAVVLLGWRGSFLRLALEEW